MTKIQENEEAFESTLWISNQVTVYKKNEKNPFLMVICTTIEEDNRKLILSCKTTTTVVTGWDYYLVETNDKFFKTNL